MRVWLEGVEGGDVEVVEVAGVAGDDGEAVDGGDGGYEGVLHEGVGLAVHEPGPDPKGRGVYGQYVVAQLHSVEPGFQLLRPGGVLLTGDLDASLDLTDGDGGQVEVIGGLRLNPVEDGRVGTRATQFRDDVRVEQVHASRTAGRHDVGVDVAAG